MLNAIASCFLDADIAANIAKDLKAREIFNLYSTWSSFFNEWATKLRFQPKITALFFSTVPHMATHAHRCGSEEMRRNWSLRLHEDKVSPTNVVVSEKLCAYIHVYFLGSSFFAIHLQGKVKTSALLSIQGDKIEKWPLAEVIGDISQATVNGGNFFSKEMNFVITMPGRYVTLVKGGIERETHFLSLSKTEKNGRLVTKEKVVATFTKAKFDGLLTHVSDRGSRHLLRVTEKWVCALPQGKHLFRCRNVMKRGTMACLYPFSNDFGMSVMVPDKWGESGAARHWNFSEKGVGFGYAVKKTMERQDGSLDEGLLLYFQYWRAENPSERKCLEHHVPFLLGKSAPSSLKIAIYEPLVAFVVTHREGSTQKVFTYIIDMDKGGVISHKVSPFDRVIIFKDLYFDKARLIAPATENTIYFCFLEDLSWKSFKATAYLNNLFFESTRTKAPGKSNNSIRKFSLWSPAEAPQKS